MLPRKLARIKPLRSGECRCIFSWNLPSEGPLALLQGRKCLSSLASLPTRRTPQFSDSAPSLPRRPVLESKSSLANAIVVHSRSQWSLAKLPPLPEKIKPFRYSLKPRRRTRIYPPIAGPVTNAMDLFAKKQIAALDPSGQRALQFSKLNKERVMPGDVVLVRWRDGTADPFAGAVIDIRRRGVDTGMLLRNHLTRLGVELWVKVYSPRVESIEIVQRRPKRARRARLYYMRKPKHDMGSVDGIVEQYLRQTRGTRANKKGKKR